MIMRGGSSNNSTLLNVQEKLKHLKDIVYRILNEVWWITDLSKFLMNGHKIIENTGEIISEKYLTIDMFTENMADLIKGLHEKKSLSINKKMELLNLIILDIFEYKKKIDLLIDVHVVIQELNKLLSDCEESGFGSKEDIQPLIRDAAKLIIDLQNNFVEKGPSEEISMLINRAKKVTHSLRNYLMVLRYATKEISSEKEYPSEKESGEMEYEYREVQEYELQYEYHRYTYSTDDKVHTTDEKRKNAKEKKNRLREDYEYE